MSEGWFQRLAKGFNRSSTQLTEGITAIFTKKPLDEETIQELEDLLISADLGPSVAAKLTQDFARTRFGKEVTIDEVKQVLAEGIAAIVQPVAQTLIVRDDKKPHVILVVGVNGAGKTTTIAKLGAQFRQNGKTVLLAAGDTFRAAAVEQLQIWGGRIGAPVIAKETGADSAALAFEALEQGARDGIDVLLIDTAGRLHNKTNLMGELQKIIRVLKKRDPEAPHSVLLVLDAVTGQNALAQVETFKDMVDVTGLVVTKLDGSAKGGMIVALAERFKLPVYAIGVGEGIDDLRPFAPLDFGRSLMGFGEVKISR